MDLYTDYLLSSFGPTTATGLSKMLDSAISHDDVTRFLSGLKPGAVAAGQASCQAGRKGPAGRRARLLAHG